MLWAMWVAPLKDVQEAVIDRRESYCEAIRDAVVLLVILVFLVLIKFLLR